MKIIFLDIDGVFNSWDWLDRNEAAGVKVSYRENFDMVAIEVMKKILERTQAKIVISSSWRIAHSLEYIVEMFKKHGLVADFVGVTPRRHEFPCRRGNEIQDWLDLHPEVTKFVIIDDDEDMEHLMNKLVRTTCKSGLLEEHIEPIVVQLL